MPHPIQHKIAILRARVRRLVAVYGVSMVVAAVLGMAVCLGLGDYLIRFQDPGIRLISSLAVLTALVWGGYRWLYLPLVARLGDVELAARLQKRFPEFDDRLLSAVEFLRQAEDEPTAGSASLRRAVISQATSESERLDFSDALDRRPPLRAAMLGSSVVLVAAILMALDPVASAIAVVRLAAPLGETTWPQTTHLAVCDPVERIARGQALEIEVEDAQGAALPPEVRIHYRFESPDGGVTEESDRMQPRGPVMFARRENITRAFQYRVTGGDDNSMPWMPVEVLEPPAVKSLEVRLSPPDYTGWPETVEPPGAIRALVGTGMVFKGRATKPLRSAVLHLEGGQEIAGQVSEDGMGFSAGGRGGADSLRVEKSGAFWFRLTDREGLTSGSDARYEIRAVPDLPPSVTIEQPRDNLFVTPRAAVSLRISAKDDLALRQIALVFSRADQAEQKEQTRPLYAGPARVEQRARSPLATGEELGDRRVVDYRWELEPEGLAPGMQIVFHAEAEDYRPQPGKSEPRRLVIITPEELQDRIAGSQSTILGEVLRLLKIQRESRSQVQATQIRLSEVGQLTQGDLDHLQAAELGQRQVVRGLTSRSEGLFRQILALLADLQSNRVDSPDVCRHMQALLDEIDRLGREHLQAIGRELTAAIKAAQIRLQDQGKPAAERATADSLARAGQHQDQVIAALEAMLGELKQWDDYRRFHRDLAQLIRDQEDAARRTSEVGRRTLTHELKDLPPQDIAELKILAGRQLELARRLDRIQQEMAETAGQLRQSDPLAADTVSDALDEARRLGIAAAMRSAGGHVQENRIGQVAAEHKQIVQGLQEVLDILANRRQHELARLVKKLREAEADLSALEQKQAGLRKEMDQTAGQADEAKRKAELERLRRQQELLQQETDRMARRLERLLAERAARTTRQAAGRMGEAAKSAGQGTAAEAAKQGEAARKTLEEAQQQLAARRLQAQTELAMEQLARLEDSLKHVYRQEQNVLDETMRLHSLAQTQGALTRAQVASVSDLARLQQSLRTEAVGLAEQIAGAAAFQLALRGAAAEMDRAAGLLEGRQIGPNTQQAERNALARLALVLKALEPESAEAKSDGQGTEGAGGKQGGQTPGGVQTLSELKLLKLLQEDVNLRTLALQQSVEGKDLTEDDRRQFASLGEEQGRLAELVIQLLRPTRQNPDDRPTGPEDRRPDDLDPLAPKEDVP